MTPLEIWGGHECTVNRIGDVWRDQTVLSGHQDRPEDIDRFASLGLKALRYPVLWERTELKQGHQDWSWADERLSRIRAARMRPVVGLLHHGSGPGWTDLLDPAFPGLLAEYALQVARRYPWVTDWTPVNEPLTTARFSCLYGHWYPHRRDEADFWVALVNQIEATQRAMEAIRSVIPGARLIQTEDFGTTWSTPPCREQAAFDNQRRFMSLDLLTGRVDRTHPLRERLDDLGLGGRLDALETAAILPDVVGVNHYVTSDRFLDHRLDRYPSAFHGGNGTLDYADVEAVRVTQSRRCGWTLALDALWRRYRLPLAVTECHLGGPESDRTAWIMDAWRAAWSARRAGIDLRAFTAWSLLGAFDWDSLLTRAEGRYEAGVFDVRSGAPVETGAADLLRRLANGGPVDQAFAKGWWAMDSRLLYRGARPHACVGS